MAALVLHLGEQRGLAAQGRRPGDPVASAMPMISECALGDLPDQRLAVGLGIQSLGSIFSSASMRAWKRAICSGSASAACASATFSACKAPCLR